jgi:Tfp pilus assembly protein PilW
MFALRLLGNDITQAGYYGLHNDGRLLTPDPNLSIRCGTRQVAAWMVATWRTLTAANNTYQLPCPARTAAIAGTDTLTARYAGAEIFDTSAGGPIIVTGFSGGKVVANLPAPTGATPQALTIRPLRVHSWYLDRDSSEPPLPALYRQTLLDDGRVQNQEIMPGVEDFQILLGIDQNNDSIADQFINPIDPLPAGQKLVSLRVQIRVRSSQPEAGHFDAGPWLSIDASKPALTPNDRFRRITVERTFAIRNQQAAL